MVLRENVIDELNLTNEDVLNIVREWYLMGMCPDIFQNADGEDLEEYIEQQFN